MDLSLVIPSFLAGLLTFLAPCTLPLVPGYLGFISGISPLELADPNRAAEMRGKVFRSGLFFILGFSIIFIVFGLLAGLLGLALAPYRIWLTRIGGVFVILFGLFMLGILKLPLLQRETRFSLPPIFERGRPLSSLLLGGAFAFGWTPCVGPILGSVLLLTASQATAAQGGVMLSVFSLGLAIPFLLIAYGAGSVIQSIRKFNRYLNIISIIGGLFLIGLGILLFLNKMSLLISYGYRLLEFINYDRLLEFL